MKVEILLVEDYTHPIEKVWAAITDPAALAQWLMVNDFEPRIGKRFTLRAEPTAECGIVRSWTSRLASNSGLSRAQAARG
jgi:uncharacterized protein YndB with AHSA1/START domain